LLSSPLLLLVGCAAEEVVLGEWEVGPDEHGHRLYGFAQAKGGRAVVWRIRSEDGSFSGPLLVAMPQLRSPKYNPEDRGAIEFKVWTGTEWQWVGVGTHRRIVRAGELYRAVLTGETVEDRRQDDLFPEDAKIVREEDDWLDQLVA
jgi:hypothetical protein